MKTVNGGLLIILAFFVLWIGVTGRFPALIAAIGLVRGSVPQPSPKSGDNTSKSGSAPLATPYPFSANALQMPILDVWKEALASIRSPEHGASASY